MATTKTVYTCPKCDGKGSIAGFRHYADGVCFECGGAKVIYLDPMTDAAKIAAATAAQRDEAIRTMAVRVDSNAGKFGAVGCLILDADRECGTWASHKSASPGSLAARIGAARHAFYAEAQAIVEQAISARSIRPSQIARLQSMAAERSTFAEMNC